MRKSQRDVQCYGQENYIIKLHAKGRKESSHYLFTRYVPGTFDHMIALSLSLSISYTIELSIYGGRNITFT